MSHRIYTTPGFVTGSRPYGEGGRILFIFTKEMGHIPALAQGIRLEKSKLRYHAQDYSPANFSLVRGKEFWRIVGVEAVANEENNKEENKDENENEKEADAGASLKTSTTDPAYALWVRILSVLSRLLQGEEKNEELFEAVLAAHDFLLSKIPTLSLSVSASACPPASAPAPLEAVEPIIMLRILSHLGYVRNIPDLKPFLTDNSFEPRLFEDFARPGMRAASIKEINSALKESQL